MSDRFKAALEQIVRRIVGKYDYAIPYACKVVAQNDDGTLELVPDDTRVPGLSNVPIRYGAPGITAKVGNGARVIVEFENADPQKPVVTSWDLSSPLVLLIIGGGSQPVARVGDMAQGGGPGTFCTITLTLPAAGTPGGLPPGSFVTGYISFGVEPPPADPTGLTAQPLYSVITTGADDFQA